MRTLFPDASPACRELCANIRAAGCDIEGATYQAEVATGILAEVHAEADPRESPVDDNLIDEAEMLIGHAFDKRERVSRDGVKTVRLCDGEGPKPYPVKGLVGALLGLERLECASSIPMDQYPTESRMLARG